MPGFSIPLIHPTFPYLWLTNDFDLNFKFLQFIFVLNTYCVLKFRTCRRSARPVVGMHACGLVDRESDATWHVEIFDISE